MLCGLMMVLMQQKDWNNKYGYKIIIISQRDHFGNTLDGFPFIRKPIDKKKSLKYC